MAASHNTPTSRLEKTWAESFIENAVTDTTSPEAATLVEVLHVEDETRKQYILSEMLKRLSSSNDNHAAFREQGGIPVIIHVMAITLPNKNMQRTCAEILISLARGEDAIAEIGEREGVQALLDAMILYRDDATVCEALVSGLRILTCVEENRARMKEYKFAELLINAMNNFIEDEALAEVIPATVANLAYGCIECREKCGELGAIECFTKGLLVHRSCKKVLAQCAFGIRNLAWECPANHERALEGQTVEVMLNVLSANRDSLEVATQVLGALANMVSLDSNIRAKLMNEKWFIADLFRMMAFFVRESKLCDTICLVLFTLAECNIQYDRAYAREIAQYCQETDGFSAIASGLDSAISSGSESTIAKFCHLIHVLSVSEEFRTDIGRSKALDALIRALNDKTRKDEVSISKLLYGILAIISGNDEAKLKFKKLNGFPVTLSTMKIHTKSEEVTLKCTQVLDNASGGQLEATEHLMKEKGEETKDEAIRVLLVAMADFAESARLQEYACSMLIKIASISPAEGAKLVQAGARNSVELARCKHIGNPGVESLANQLLSLLVDNSSGRGGRGNFRGNASSRLRSRSRTIQATDRARSRAEKSKSPDRMMKQARRAMEAAKMKQGSQDGDAKDSERVAPVPSVVHVKRNPRKKLSLEPVYE